MGARRINVEVGADRGVFMISVAAELAGMHPQTLRMYEQRGLIEPKRSAKGTRLYSRDDVERLGRIQQMTAELGMNLAGVERVFELEAELEGMAARLAELERRTARPPARDRVAGGTPPRRVPRADVIPYAAISAELVPLRHSRPLWVTVRRSTQRPEAGS